MAAGAGALDAEAEVGPRLRQWAWQHCRGRLPPGLSVAAQAALARREPPQKVPWGGEEALSVPSLPGMNDWVLGFGVRHPTPVHLGGSGCLEPQRGGAA